MEPFGAWASGLGNSLALIVAIGAQNALVLRIGIRGRNIGVAILVCVLSDVLLMGLGVLGIGAIVAAAPWFVQVATWAGVVFLVGYAALAFRRAMRPSALIVAEETDPPAGGTARAAGDGGHRHDGGMDAGRPAVTASAGVAERAEAPGHSPAVRTATVPSTAGDPGSAVRTAADDGSADDRRRGERRATILALLAVTYLNPHCYLDTVVLIGSIANTHGETLRWVFFAGAISGSVLWFLALGFGARRLRPLFASPASWRVLDIVIGIVMLGIAASLAFG